MVVAEPTETAAPRAELWVGVNRLIEEAQSLDALRAHRLHLLAAASWRASGRRIPADLVADERRSTMLALSAPALLRSARDAYDGTLVLMKGPEVAAHYADPATRPFRDLDLLADDPDSAQRALLAAGFRRVEYPDGWKEQHHLCPLFRPGLPLTIEIHRAPKLPDWLPAPDLLEVIGSAVPSATGIDGLLTPDRATHALLLTAHGWAHRPLGRLGDVVDIAAILGPDGRAEAAARARRWGWGNVWGVTQRVVDALLEGGDAPIALRTWARYLAEVRDISVLEHHLLRVIGAGAGAPAGGRLTALIAAARQTASPWRDETWTEKLARARIALGHPLATQSQHDHLISLNPWRR